MAWRSETGFERLVPVPAGSRAAGFSRVLAALILLLSAGGVRAAERPVEILGGRKLSVQVPKDWTFEEVRDPKSGIPALRWLEPSGEVRLDVSFFPDANGWVSTREGLDAEMEKIFAFYRDGAVEKEKKAVNLKPQTGIGAYMSFTDRSLSGKTLPPGERLVSTTGIRSWKGAYLVFTLLSNSRDSAAYRQALEIVRSGVKETGR
jgi:hypothetical protein